MDLINFLQETQREVREEVNSRLTDINSSSVFPELIFTEIVTQHMSNIGMTFEPVICHFAAKISNANLRISGYSISDDTDQLDLYVSLYQGADELITISDADVSKAAEQCARFLTACVSGKLISDMDETNEAYPLVLTVNAAYTELEQIRIYILTDCQVKNRSYQARIIQDKTIKLEVMDIVRLFNHLQEGKPRDELVINFEEVSGTALPCIWIPGEMGEYDYAMTAIPGDALRFVYEKYGARILEDNVRSFLSQTGKVNQGIRNTLRDYPERFMAYNNGVVIVADEIEIGRCSDGSVGVLWLKGMQIVNGGQTTASMYFSKRKNPSIDLGRVRVPAKIIVLRDTDALQEELLISDISKFANSQNAVKQSDLSANKPFHVEMEKLAMNTFCPDGVGRWFYERSTGSYKVLLEREGKTPAGIKRLQLSMPTSRKITKTDLAKYLCSWAQHPDIVSLGGQKNFTAFMSMGDESTNSIISIPDTSKFKELIAQCIIFKTAHKHIRSKFPAFQANIAAYTVSITSMILSDSIDLMKIWAQQSISSELTQQILIWSEEVNKYLHDTSKGKMISEWAKKDECWDILRRKNYQPVFTVIPELH
jgi:hypothetical protein